MDVRTVFPREQKRLLELILSMIWQGQHRFEAVSAQLATLLDEKLISSFRQIGFGKSLSLGTN